MGRLPVPQKKAVQLPVFLRKKNGLVPVSHRLFVEVFVSGNKSCLYGYDVPDTSIYQKDHWTGIPGSDPTILYLYEYSCAVTPQVRQTGNRLSGLAGTAYASLLT
jgi:hypothetical protein